MKRKLKIFLIGLILCCFNFNIFSKDNNSVIWGIKAKIDAELPGKWHGNNNSVKIYNPGIGFTIGGFSNIYLGKNFYFEPGVSFFYSQYKYDLIIEIDALESYKDPKLYKIGLQVPLVFGYTIDFSDKFSMDIFTGPQFRYAFGGKVIIKDKAIEEQVKDVLDLWNVQRRFDCAWKVGIGFPIREFTVSLEADFGLTDLLKEGMSFRENRIGLGLTYYF